MGKCGGPGSAAPSTSASATLDGLGVPSFVPARTFEGVRPGYVFRSGAEGLGYYNEADAATASAHPTSAAVEAALQGKRKTPDPPAAAADTSKPAPPEQPRNARKRPKSAQPPPDPSDVVDLCDSD